MGIRLDAPHIGFEANRGHAVQNPILGDYKDACVVLGQLQDTEFDVIRDPVTSECDDAQPVTAWRNAHAFRSSWNAE